MNARVYLSQLYRLNEMIDSNIEEIKKLRTLCTDIPATDFSKERVSGGGSNDKIATLVSRIVDLESEIQDEIEEYVDLEREVREAINRHKDVNERLLLRLRYIEFDTWEQIAMKMDYSTMTIWRIHKNALKNFVIPEK